MQCIQSGRHISHFLITLYLGFSFFLLSIGTSPAGETVTFPEGYPQTINGISNSFGPLGSSTGKTPGLDGNRATLINGTVIGIILGAVNLSDDEAVINNQVVIGSGGNAQGDIYGGWCAAGASTGNSVAIKEGGTAHGSIYGGYSGAGDAANNSVTIEEGGTARESIYGGYSEAGDAVNNSVTITGAPDLSAARLYGGYSTGSGDVFTGNTLTLHSANVAVTEVKNFQILNFYLPANTANGDTVLAVSGEADISGATVNVGVEGGSSPLQSGDRVILIDATTLTGTPVNSTSSAQGMHGITLRYDFLIETAGNLLTARLEKVEVNERIKALSEGFLSSLALARQGADLIAGQGIDQAVAAVKEHGLGLCTFGAVSGNWSRYNTGSHVNVSGVSLIAGLAKGADLSPGHLTLGAFFEYGTGTYDTYNSFSNSADVRGNGHAYHLGGGVLARMNFNPADMGRFYAEGSFRAGGLHNEYNSDDLRDLQGRKASYNHSSPYYGLHAGAGYIWSLTESTSLDTYIKYFWTRQKGESVKISTGERVDFDNADSHRIRVGGRLDWALHEQITPYIGAAYEYEFNGEINAGTNGYALDSPDLRGGTGVGELGLLFQPSANLPVFCKLGVQGYTGVREGVTGSLNITINF